MNYVNLVGIFLYALVFVHTLVQEDSYFKARDCLIKADYFATLGSRREFNAKEKIANAKLMFYKHQELDTGYKNSSKFLAAQHFFKVRDQISQSKVFQIIKKFPKGALLHGHSPALLSMDKVFEVMNKYIDDLYVCFEKNDFRMKYFLEPDGTCKWLLLNDLRKKHAHFDNYVRSKISLVVDNPEETYKTEQEVWEQFDRIFFTFKGILQYKPFYQLYMYEVLQELFDDNIINVEMRVGFSPIYDLNGNYSEAAEVLREVGINFEKSHKNFQGLKIIMTASRKHNRQTIRNYIKKTIMLAEKYPDTVVGFDIVGNEDEGKSLLHFIDILLEFSGRIKYFFHAGETKLHKNSVDGNLFDAVLLNSTRIGHGYAAFEHPEIMKKIREKKIPLEICPISNQVLKLITDLRNHPANFFISLGHPVVISNDDPSYWGAKALSYDWYYAFMAMTSRKADLRFLETLAINSIMATASTTKEKEIFLIKWRQQWDKFIDELSELQL